MPRILVVSLIIVFVLMFFNYQGWLDMVKGLTLKAAGWLQAGIYDFFSQAHNFIRALAGLPEIVEENKKLKQANLFLLGDLALLREVWQENVFLRSQSQVAPLQGEEYILAEVISQGVRQLDQIIFINQGANNGITKGRAVITAKNVLVGQVIEVYPDYAKIRLITDTNSQVNALIQENQVSGLIFGQGGRDLLFDLLPQGENIEQGQLALSSGAAGIFPKGLLVGQIKEVVSLDAQISQKAIVEPAFRISQLKRVLVVK